MTSNSNYSSNPVSKLDLDKINSKLIKYGESPLKALYGSGNCAICLGDNPSEKWSLLVPCGHIICTPCMITLHNTQNIPIHIHNKDQIKCPICCAICKSYKLCESKHSSTQVLPLNQSCAGSNLKITNLRHHVHSLINPIFRSHYKDNSTEYNSLKEGDITTIKKSIPPLTNDRPEGKNKSEIKLSFAVNDRGYGIIKFADSINNMTQQLKPPIDAVLLLDVSGSVEPYFEDFCKMIKDFIDTLSENDRFTLITFSTTTTQPFPLQPVISKQNNFELNSVKNTDFAPPVKEQMKNLIKPNKTYWSSTTNLKAGAHHSLEVLKEGQIVGRTMHFILVTDGRADSGYGGHHELKGILSIPNVVVKMCTFGKDIDSHILTDVLGKKIQDYIHLADSTDFNKMVKTVGLERLSVVADNISLQVKENGIVKIFPLPQLRTGEEILFPLTFDNLGKNIEISATYTNNLGEKCETITTNDDILQSLIETIHTKKKLGNDMMGVLEDIQSLRNNYKMMTIGRTLYDESIKKHKVKLNAIYENIMASQHSTHRKELLNLYNTISTVIGCAEHDPELFLRNSNSSNVAYSTCYRLLSSNSKSTY